MPRSHSPQVPQFRFTLFYGPERKEDAHSIQSCVFNVKKRSWKGGIQVLVELDDVQFIKVQTILEFREWLTELLNQIPESDRAHYSSLAEDILVQRICQVKLQLALAQGIQQENSCIQSDEFALALEQEIKEKVEEVKAQILNELDLDSCEGWQEQG